MKQFGSKGITAEFTKYGMRTFLKAIIVPHSNKKTHHCWKKA
jgi:hypothetical protein